MPTDRPKAAAHIADHPSRVQVQTLENNCAELGVPVHSIGSARQGTVHVIGPERAYPNDIKTRNAQLAAVQINGNPSTQSATTPSNPPLDDLPALRRLSGGS